MKTTLKDLITKCDVTLEQKIAIIAALEFTRAMLGNDKNREWITKTYGTIAIEGLEGIDYAKET